MIYIVDTHALVFFITESERLGKQAAKILRDPKKTLVIPSIVLAEIKYLAAKKRIAVLLDEILQYLRTDPRCTVYSLDLDVVLRMPIFNDIHDGIICGTALVYEDDIGEKTTIITKDQSIRGRKDVKSIW